MSYSSTLTARERLIDTARTLFAEEGVEAVSLRAVARQAEQRNTNAVQYHFEDRTGLLAAVLEVHHQQVTARRVALLEPLALLEDPPLRGLADALVRPSAAMLAEPGGLAYLRIVAELIDDPPRLFRFGDAGLGRWSEIAKRRMPDETYPLHRRLAAIQLCFQELGRRATARRRRDHRLFVSNLTDLVSALLDAEVSADTVRLLEERDARSPARPSRS